MSCVPAKQLWPAVSIGNPQSRKDFETNGGLDEPGVNENIDTKFPGASVAVGSTGASGNREIPLEEGGDLDDKGRPTKAKHFEGQGGPETKAQLHAEQNPGADDVRENIRGPSGDKSL